MPLHDSEQLPNPRLVFRVGFTGHRPRRLKENAADLTRLEDRAREALRIIRETVEQLYRAGEVPCSREAPVVRLVSSLADGADRVVARAARTLGYDLQAILPYKREAFERDFEAQSAPDGRPSKEEFDGFLRLASAVMELDADPESETRYVAGGLAVVTQCDLLLTIWDGKPERGPGGSAANVSEAVRLDVPVLWIDARGPNHEMGMLTPSRTGLTRDAWDEARLRARVRELLLLAEPVRAQHAAAPTIEPRRSLEAFLSPDAQPAPLVNAYRRVISAFAFGSQPEELRAALDIPSDLITPPPDSEESASSPRRGAASEPPLVAKVESRVPSGERTESLRDLLRVLAGHFGSVMHRADDRGVLYAVLYRNAMTQAYVAAALAVVFAALGLYLAATHDATVGSAEVAHSVNWIAVVAVSEGVSLAWIWFLYQDMTTLHFHQRWLDSRSIAEKLRHIMVLSALGSPSLGVRFSPTLDATDPRSSWTNWYLRALVREAGVLPLQLWIPSVRAACRTLVSWWLIRDQASYHFGTTLRIGTAHARISLARNGAFVLTVVLAIIHLLAAFVSGVPFVKITEAVLGFGTVAFPVVATALHAFSNQMSLENTALRSAAVLPRLRDAHGALESLRNPSSIELTQITITVSEILLGELVEWRGDLSTKVPLIP